MLGTTYTISLELLSRLSSQNELPYSLYDVCLLHRIGMVHDTIYFTYLIRYIHITVVTSSIYCSVLFTFSCIGGRGLMQCRNVRDNHSRVIIAIYRDRCTRRIGMRSRLRLLCHNWCSNCNSCICSRSISCETITIIGFVMTSRMQVIRKIPTTD
jgi:hypothetical protein